MDFGYTCCDFISTLNSSFLMSLSIIAALSTDKRVIGVDNRLPWHLPADLRHFKALTLGKAVIMGRKTFESIGRPLPGRRMIIVSRSRDYQVQDCEVVGSLEQALARVDPGQEAMLIGGAQLFELALPIVDRLYLTLIHHEFVGDCYFPAWEPQEWREMERVDHVADQDNPYNYSFVTFERIYDSLPPLVGEG